MARALWGDALFLLIFARGIVIRVEKETDAFDS